MNWDDIRTFLAIARSRTLSGAARSLGVRQSTMSRRLSALEGRAAARLLQKTPSGYDLTALGERVLGNAERMEAEAINVERAVVGRDTMLSGSVRVTTVDTLATMLLPRVILRVRRQHPGIELEILPDSRSLSLARREADIALRLTRFEGHQLVARRIGICKSGLYASSGYLAENGSPNADGNGHSLITTLDDQQHLPEVRWLETRFPRAAVAVRSNSREVHLAATREGLGLAQMTEIQASAVPELVRLDDQMAPPIPPRELWLGVHEDMRQMPRVRIVIDAINEETRSAGLVPSR